MSKPSVIAFMITRADTPERIALYKDTVESAFDTAHYPFQLETHLMYPRPYPKEMGEVIHYLSNDRRELAFSSRGWKENVGQHVITNYMLDFANNEGYDYILRLDDDCKFLTKGWLKKMIEAAETLGPDFIISPMVRGLNFPPEMSETVEVEGISLRLLTSAIGGVCRLHSVIALNEPDTKYRADIRHPLGAGDATGIGKWCQRNMKWMVWLEHVRVKHSTNKQRAEDPDYHKYHDLFQYIPYIPKWSAT